MNLIFFSRREGRARHINLAHPVTVGAVGALALGVLGIAFVLGLELGQRSGKAFSRGDTTHWSQVVSAQQAEIAEMKGMRGRQSESTKAFITRRTEEWIPKYRELAVRFQRRVVFWGSANEHGLLDDATGERRWLPVEVTGRLKPAQLRKDRDQLWAEGVARFALNGVEWGQAQELAKPEHAKFKIVDERQEIVARWLAQPRAHVPGQPVDDTPNGERAFTIVELAVEALGYRTQQVGRSEQMVIGKILSGLGYVTKMVWDKEVRAPRRGWVKK